ncbi:MAG: hypothetical protein KBD06_05415, partial [Candidatus Pacebacteria bacterium]|nr:hypothetical protein [Candidatus Paceibacterota bacterium]
MSQNSPRLLIRYSVVGNIVAGALCAAKGTTEMNAQWDINSIRVQYVVALYPMGYTRGMENPRLPDRSKRHEGVEVREAWHVAEAFSEARDQVRGSEDGYLVTEHCIAVFDGVSRNGTKYDGVTPG